MSHLDYCIKNGQNCALIFGAKIQIMFQGETFWGDFQTLWNFCNHDTSLLYFSTSPWRNQALQPKI